MTLAAMKAAFEAAHRARFGFIDETKDIVVEAVSVEAVGGGAKFAEKEIPRQGPLAAPGEKRAFFPRGAWHEARVLLREQLLTGHRVAGPALVIEPNQTVMVEDGWQAGGHAQKPSRAHARENSRATKAIGTEADPVMLEVFNNLFMSIAEQMGVTLQNTAYSVNIKERLDFSCAVFDGEGNLVANAPHMPVHLGSMDRSVETVFRENRGRLKPGDVYALNAPYNGGTHLPDITVCTPVFDDDRQARSFSGSRAAAITPMSAASRRARCRRARPRSRRKASISTISSSSIEGRFRERELNELLLGREISGAQSGAEHQRPESADRRQRKGRAELKKIIADFGFDVVTPIWAMCRTTPRNSVRRVLDRLHDSEFSYEMDQGTVIKVKISVDKKKREATVDFTGTSPQQPTNFNAPAPVTRAAVLYVFRVMVDDEIPMNAGCLRPISIVVPESVVAFAGISGGGRRRQCGNLAGGDELSVRRARRARCGSGHHEQSHLWQRALPVLRDDLLRLASRTWFRRHRRRAYAHDQHAPHRSGSSRIPLSGAAGRFPYPAEFRRTWQMECRQRHLTAPSDFWRRWIVRFCPAIAACGRLVWRAERPASSARIPYGGATATWSRSKDAIRRSSKPGEAVTVICPTGGGYGDPKERPS